MPAILGNIDISKMFLGSSEIVKAYLGEQQIFSSTQEVGSFLYSWGDNANGRTGLDTTSGNTLVPTRVGTANNWSTVSAGSTHSLATNTNDNAFSWGDRSNGRIIFSGSLTGNIVVPTQLGTGTDYVQVEASRGGYTLVLRDFGPTTANTMLALGDNSFGATGQNTATGNASIDTQAAINGMRFVSAGVSHSLIIDTSNNLRSFGDNSNGRTGLNTTTGNTLVPTLLGSAFQSNWNTVSAGTSHSLGIKTNGQLFAWGQNSLGRTGLDTTTGNTVVPTQVGSASNWSAVSAGGLHSLAINTDGELYAWGSNLNGRTGFDTDTGNTLVPTRVGTANNWVAISAGGSHSLAINTDGELFAWGDNSNGRTGLDTTTGNTLVPTRVGTRSNWSFISAGTSHSLAIETIT